jgi:hypothetical protein
VWEVPPSGSSVDARELGGSAPRHALPDAKRYEFVNGVTDGARHEKQTFGLRLASARMTDYEMGIAEACCVFEPVAECAISPNM